MWKGEAGGASPPREVGEGGRRACPQLTVRQLGIRAHPVSHAGCRRMALVRSAPKSPCPQSGGACVGPPQSPSQGYSDPLWVMGQAAAAIDLAQGQRQEHVLGAGVGRTESAQKPAPRPVPRDRWGAAAGGVFSRRTNQLSEPADGPLQPASKTCTGTQMLIKRRQERA